MYDVSLLYVVHSGESWAEYDWMRTPQLPKRTDAHVAAFISNCGPQYRLNYMKELIDNGVIVHSMGSCLKNRDVSQNNGHNRDKIEIGGQYKFIMAFENSETDDYVTEKMFEVLVAGSVPIYHGAPNAKKICTNQSFSYICHGF